jgi:copper transport protein
VTPLARRHGYFLWCCCALLLALAQPSPALAHASLISSDPAAETVLATAPVSLTLTFNEAVEPLAVRIVDQRGVATIVTQIERRGANLVLMPPADLAPGAYIMSWRVASEDGHPVGGALTFWIGARSATAPSVASGEYRALRFAIWVTRIAVYVGLFVGAGGAFFMAWMRMTAFAGLRSVVAAASLAGLSALALSVGLQGLDALAAPASDLALPAVWRAGIRGSFGAGAAIAALAMLAGLLSLGLRAWPARCVSLPALFGVGVALATTGHAATAEPRSLATAAVALHGIGLAFWIGALVPLGFALGAREAATQPLIRFSRTIPFAVVALLASGLLLAILQVEHFAALWTTDYGRVLIAKLTLVAILLAIALWNRVSLTPGIVAGGEASRCRMRRSIAGELLLVVAILGAVALWRFTPPPRLLVEKADEFLLHIHAEKAMANVTITPGSAGPVDIDVQLETPDERSLVAMAVSVTLAYPELGIEPMTGQAERQHDGHWRVRMSVSVPGRWTLGLGILISDFEKISVEAPVLIK